MPTYVYECRKCGKVFEADQRITENALTDCDCGAVGALRRLIQPVGIAFKGTGFHINDYAPKGTPTDASESKAAETAKTDTATSTPAEAKPAEGSPAKSDVGDSNATVAKPVESAAPPAAEGGQKSG